MSRKICDTNYAQGRAAFNGGASLRSIVEHIASSDDDPKSEVEAFSRALGFADALLDRVRNGTAVTKSEIVEIVRDAERDGVLK